MKYYSYDEKSLEYKDITPFIKQNNKGNIVVGFIIGFMFCFTSTFLILHQIDKNSSKEPQIIKVCEYPEPYDMGFSEQALINYMIEINVKYPHIALAQTKIETGNFTSQIFKENHNLFGMREAKQRPKLAKGTNRAHAYYENWKESVLDYTLWACRYAPLESEKAYLEYLGKVYAEDKNYLNKVTKLKEQLRVNFEK